MGGYPPGAKNDPRAPYNQPDMSHTHEWEPDEGHYPFFEDGAAMFHEECRWRMVLKTEQGYRGERVVTESIPCEEDRWVRFDVVRIETPDGETLELGDRSPADADWLSESEPAVVAVEMGDPDIVNFAGPHDDDELVVEAAGFRVYYADRR